MTLVVTEVLYVPISDGSVAPFMSPNCNQKITKQKINELI